MEDTSSTPIQQYNKTYYEEHKTERKNYYLANRAQRLAYQKAYVAAHRAQNKTYCDAYYQRVTKHKKCHRDSVGSSARSGVMTPIPKTVTKKAAPVTVDVVKAFERVTVVGISDGRLVTWD